MSLAEDIKGIIAETGVRLKILRDGGDVSGEYANFKPNSQVTKPFIREHFFEGQVSYDSTIVAGDILQDDWHTRYLAMNVTPEILELTQISKNTIFYKCNVSGEVLRVSGERDATSYRMAQTYTSLRQNCYALLTDTSVGTDILQNEELGQIETTTHFLFIPKSVGIQPLDVYIPYSGEYYKVESVETVRFPAVYVCKLTENTID